MSCIRHFLRLNSLPEAVGNLQNLRRFDITIWRAIQCSVTAVIIRFSLLDQQSQCCIFINIRSSIYQSFCVLLVLIRNLTQNVSSLDLGDNRISELPQSHLVNLPALHGLRYQCHQYHRHHQQHHHQRGLRYQCHRLLTVINTTTTITRSRRYHCNNLHYYHHHPHHYHHRGLRYHPHHYHHQYYLLSIS